MGKIIPFKQKQSAEEKSLRGKLKSNPDDLETWGKLLILKIQQGKFSPESEWEKKKRFPIGLNILKEGVEL